jgi:acetyl-CoA carboxylase/biotin carboxylase 1
VRPPKGMLLYGVVGRARLGGIPMSAIASIVRAIFDFDREGLLLIIFANWRGFSRGQRDMYDEVFEDCGRPLELQTAVLDYIVPNGELRGGAWVALDPSINAEQMGIYEDVEARHVFLNQRDSSKSKYVAKRYWP